MSDPFEPVRRRMASRHLAARDIRDLRVLDAFRRVPRERFVPDAERRRAYVDHPLPIAHDQTISQPYIVALMTQCLELVGAERVLEIGTGSGYQTAILCELAERVFSVERIADLSEHAGQTLDALGYANATLCVADGTLGLPKDAPFDRIIVTAGAPEIPPALTEQLAEGGILVMPVGPVGLQSLTVVRKHAGGTHSSAVCDCVFVKLIGEAGYDDGCGE